MNFLFTILQNNTNYLIELEDVCYKDSRAIEGGWLFFKLNVKVDMRQKIAITGGTANGKSSFLKLLGREVSCGRGNLRAPGPAVTPLFNHDLIKRISEHQGTPMDAIVDNLPQRKAYIKTAVKPPEKEHLLRFGLTESELQRSCSQLTKGQCVRIGLALVASQPAYYLILDEPTDGLDIDGINELIIALQKFPNGFAVVSNNVNFVRQITPQIYELTSSGKLEEFVGDIVQYDTASKQRVADKLAKLARSD